MSESRPPQPSSDDAIAELLRDRRTPTAALERLAARGELLRRRGFKLRFAMHPNAPLAPALRMLDDLLWRELAEAALGPSVQPVVRRRAEEMLRTRAEGLSTGERIGLARRSPRSVMLVLLEDLDDRVLAAVLDNPRLFEADVLRLAGRPRLGPAALSSLGRHPRWGELRAVRIAVASHPRTPTAISLRFVRRLARNDLRAIVGNPRVPQLVRVAAERRLALGLREGPGSGAR